MDKRLINEPQLKRNTKNGKYIGTTIFYEQAIKIRIEYKEKGYRVKMITTQNIKKFGHRHSIYRLYIKKK